MAHAAFPAGNVYLQMRDELGTIYENHLFAAVYSAEGHPSLHPWQLALVSVMQFAENLSDRQAADAVRARIDWKYALGLELSDIGFHYSVLSEFRARLIEGNLEHLLLDTLLEACRQRGWLKVRGRQRTDSTHVLAAVKALNHLELVGETMRHALNILATVVPEWLGQHTPPEWFDRYSQRVEDYRLPKDKRERDVLSDIIGADGYQLLTFIAQATDLPWLATLPAVQTLIQVWQQQYHMVEGQV